MTQEQILKAHIKLSKKLKRFPTIFEMKMQGLGEGTIKYYFGNLTTLRKASEKFIKFKKTKPSSLDELLKEVMNEAQ